MRVVTLATAAASSGVNMLTCARQTSHQPSFALRRWRRMRTLRRSMVISVLFFVFTVYALITRLMKLLNIRFQRGNHSSSFFSHSQPLRAEDSEFSARYPANLFVAAGASLNILTARHDSVILLDLLIFSERRQLVIAIKQNDLRLSCTFRFCGVCHTKLNLKRLASWN